MKILSIVRRYNSFATLFVACFLWVGCQSDPKNTTEEDPQEPTEEDDNDQVANTNQTTKLNISFLVDLSDRISTKKYPNSAMEYYQRDLGYIKSITQGFKNHIRGKKIVLINDDIQTYFDPTPSNPEINSISNSLKLHYDRHTISKDKLETELDDYPQKMEKIYELALKDNNFVGADIWGFFKNKVKKYCINEGSRNILFIFTDGYMYHKDNEIRDGNATSYLTSLMISKYGFNKSDWKEKVTNGDYKFIPSTSGLDDLEVYILGVNPNPKNPYERDVLEHYWFNWLKGMGVKNYGLETAELPSDLASVLNDIVQGN